MPCRRVWRRAPTWPDASRSVARRVSIFSTGCCTRISPAEPKAPRPRIETAASLFKNHGAVAVEQNAVFHVPAHGLGQNHLFQITAFLDQVFDIVFVRDADDTLFDNRTIVENLRYIMRGRANQLDAAIIGLMVRLASNKRRQERMMDVDDGPGEMLNELVRKNLHVTGENDQVNLLALQEPQLRGFGLRFAFLVDGYELKQHPIEIRVVFRLRMVADDQRKITS